MNTPERLPFWHFFHRIERELSYERWVDKYRLLHQALLRHDGLIQWDNAPEGDPWAGFKRFCKILYLQDHRDEARFMAILEESIALEEKTMRDVFSLANATTPNTGETAAQTGETTDNATAPSPEGATGNIDPKKPKDKTKTTKKEPAADETLYFHPILGDSVPTSAPTPDRIDAFLHTDEYFPVTRRQMGVAWQYLRRKESGRIINEVDIEATVKNVSKEGIFLEPTYRRAIENRSDNLIFFADVRGSMTPFNEFTRRLIHSARTEGGHDKAGVYYFQNYPAGFVYRKPNLSDPMKLSTTLQKTNKNATMAIIISDACAAQPDKAPSDFVAHTDKFLNALYERVAHIIWLNPMPRHRWAGTPAAIIEQKVTVMAPVFDEAIINFPNTIRLLLKA
jgi:uncharacterized protein